VVPGVTNEIRDAIDRASRDEESLTNNLRRTRMPWRSMWSASENRRTKMHERNSVRKATALCATSKDISSEIVHRMVEEVESHPHPCSLLQESSVLREMMTVSATRQKVKWMATPKTI